MALDWNHGSLGEGLKCYRNREYFLAHEHWEEAWRASTGEEKAFLQALIQITVAFHQIQRQNILGARSMLNGALRRLEPLPDDFEGMSLPPLRENIRAWLNALDSTELPLTLSIPEL